MEGERSLYIVFLALFIAFLAYEQEAYLTCLVFATYFPYHVIKYEWRRKRTSSSEQEPAAEPEQE